VCCVRCAQLLEHKRAHRTSAGLRRHPLQHHLRSTSSISHEHQGTPTTHAARQQHTWPSGTASPFPRFLRFSLPARPR
jgi:hypothetical protein